MGEERGEHEKGNCRLLLSKNETDINSMNSPIEFLGWGNTEGKLVGGYPKKVKIKKEKGYRIE